MHARNKTTRAEVTGTLEVVYGQAYIEEGSFKRNENGELTFKEQPNTDTELTWESSGTVREDGKPVFLDTNGDQIGPDEIELFEEANPAPAPSDTTPAA